MASKAKLGKGLGVLLGNGAKTLDNNADRAANLSNPQPNETLKYIPVDLVQRGKYQPRRDMNAEALNELCESIKAQGVMQPIVIRPIEGGLYEIIAGERRWRATQLAGLSEIPAVIRDVPDEAAIAMALIENIQRENLNPIEEAMALKQLQDEFELTHQEVANAVGKSRAAVSNLLRLMNLDVEVKKLLEHGDIEMGHARALLSLDCANQKSAAKQIVNKSLSVRQSETLVRRLLTEKNSESNSEYVKSPDIIRLEETLSEKFGAPTLIHHSAKGKGKLVIKYNDLDELDGILAHLSPS